MILALSTFLAGSGVVAPTVSPTAGPPTLVSAATTNVYAITNSDFIAASNLFSGGVYGQNWVISVPSDYSLEDMVSGDESVGTITGNEVQYVSSGTVGVGVRMLDANRRRVGSVVNVSMATSSGDFSTLTFNSFLPGTVGASAMATLTASSNLSSQMWESSTNRSASFWLAGATNLSALPYGRGVLVSSNVLLVAAHAGYGTNSVVSFQTESGSFVTNVVLANTNLATDLQLCLLSGSPGIAPMKLVPSNWLSFAPSAASTAYNFPLIFKEKTGLVYTLRTYSCTSNRCAFFNDTVFIPTKGSTPQNGDSGGAVMVAANNTLFALGTLWAADRCELASFYLNEINAAITNMATIHNQPTNAASVGDWSAFTAF